MLLKGIRDKDGFGNVILELWNAADNMKEKMKTILEWLGRRLSKKPRDFGFSQCSRVNAIQVFVST